MLDTLLQGQAVLSYLTLLFRMGIVGLTLVLLSAISSKYIFRDRGGLRFFLNASFFLGALLIGCSVIGLLFGSISKYFYTQPILFALNADLSGAEPGYAPFGQNCKDMKWGRMTRRDCLFEGQREVVLILAGGKSLRETVRMVWVSGEPNRLESIKLFTVAVSREAAFRKASALLAQWNISDERLERWNLPRAKGDRESYFHASQSATPESPLPKISLAIKPLEGSDHETVSQSMIAGAWFLSIELRWI